MSKHSYVVTLVSLSPPRRVSPSREQRVDANYLLTPGQGLSDS